MSDVISTKRALITIHIDGLCQPKNPGGYACWAYVATDEAGHEIALNYGCVGNGAGMSNNIAEYASLKAALERAREMGWYNCRIQSHSQLVVNQVNGEWNCNAPHLYDLMCECAKLLTDLQARLSWIPREQNERADHLSNVAYRKARQGVLA
jgi:ribonuclease HI